MRTILGSTLLLLLTFAVANPASAQTEYSVTVELDESTGADYDLLSAAATVAPDGPVSQAIRKLSASITGEVRHLLHSRLQQGVLTLDDGNTVYLNDYDKVTAKVRTFGGFVYEGKDGKPHAVVIRFRDGSMRCIVGLGSGKPHIGGTDGPGAACKF